MTRSERTRQRLHVLALTLFALFVAGAILGGGILVGSLIGSM